jgi:hypothetical protein
MTISLGIRVARRGSSFQASGSSTHGRPPLWRSLGEGLAARAEGRSAVAEPATVAAWTRATVAGGVGADVGTDVCHESKRHSPTAVVHLSRDDLHSGADQERVRSDRTVADRVLAHAANGQTVGRYLT